MADDFNIYCDESCHLERDGIPVMVLGAIWCKADRSREIAVRLREIKQEHKLLHAAELKAPMKDPKSRPFEVKWTKVSPGKVDFYLKLVDYFFDDDDLHFRCVLIDKTVLNHTKFNQTHDEWYYKMLFTMLEPVIDPEQQYRIFLDMKDTCSERRGVGLLEYLRTARHDSDHRIIDCVQQIRSHESELMQLADLLIGAVMYHNRNLRGDLPRKGGRLNSAKLDIIRRIQQRSSKSLDRTTWLRESKFNMLRWEPLGAG